MDQKIIRRAEKGPRQRKFRADEALNVAPLLAVVPQADMEALEGDETGEIFRHGHAYCHDQEQDHAIPERVADDAELLQRGNQIEKAQTAAIQRQIWSDAEAGIDPLALRVRRREKAAEQQLQHPAQRCTDEKQEGKRQKNIHGSSMRHALGFVDIIIFCFRPKRKG